ncbi:hypothetical protein PYW07_004775 [Mythimna separata]|uniref:Uncharacterized protein n=1 Tax=Mythimna separata TaxID=271217 RepID=A0AAD7YYA8_MYTSE|nr:hypothetical protein PYW07_004775 [Mythimna separata]
MYPRCTCGVPSVTIHFSVFTAAVAGVTMSPAALVLLSINTGADLVAGSNVDGLDGHHHHGDSDQQENEGGLDSGHFVCCLVVEKLLQKDAVHVGPCDQVCSRIDAEKDECCRAHGHSGYSSCKNGKMNCY